MSEETPVEVIEQVPAEQVAPEPVQPEQPVETKPEALSLDQVEARIEERLRAEREAWQRDTDAKLERVKQSSRDSTRERFDQIAAQLEALKLERQDEVRAMARGGQIDPTQAALRLSEIDADFHKRRLAEQAQVMQQPVQPAPQYNAPDPNLAWNDYKREIMDALDLTGNEPEFRQMVAGFGNPSTLAEAQAKFKREAKNVRKQVDARVNKPAPAPVQQKPPTLEVGGGTPIASGNAQEELQKLINSPLPNDPKARQAHIKRVAELEKKLGWD